MFLLQKDVEDLVPLFGRRVDSLMNARERNGSESMGTPQERTHAGTTRLESGRWRCTHGRVVGATVDEDDGPLRGVLQVLQVAVEIESDGLLVVVPVRDGLDPDVGDDGIVVGCDARRGRQGSPEESVPNSMS